MLDRSKTKARAKLMTHFDRHPDLRRSDVAVLCGMSTSQLQHLVDARRTPTLAQAVHIEMALKIAPRDWLR